MRKDYIINSHINAKRVICINVDNKSLGELSLDEALKIAKDNDMDLIQVSYDEVPVVKMMDYELLLSKERIKRRKAHKSHKVVQKEIKFNLKIDDNDYRIKCNHAIQFLEKGYNVTIVIVMHGREKKYKDEAIKMLEKLRDELSEYGGIDFDKITAKGNSGFSFLIIPKKH